MKERGTEQRHGRSTEIDRMLDHGRAEEGRAVDGRSSRTPRSALVRRWCILHSAPVDAEPTEPPSRLGCGEGELASSAG